MTIGHSRQFYEMKVASLGRWILRIALGCVVLYVAVWFVGDREGRDQPDPVSQVERAPSRALSKLGTRPEEAAPKTEKPGRSDAIPSTSVDESMSSAEPDRPWLDPKYYGTYRLRDYDRFPLAVQRHVDELLSEAQRANLEAILFAEGRFITADVHLRSGEEMTEEAVRAAEVRAELTNEITDLQDDYLLVREIDGKFDEFPDVDAAKEYLRVERTKGRKLKLQRAGNGCRVYDMEDLYADPRYQELKRQKRDSMRGVPGSVDVVEAVHPY